MSTYSDVRVSTTREGFEHFKKRIDKYDTPYVVKAEDEDNVVFGWDMVKWYPSFPVVKTCYDTLAELEDKGVPWEYVEVVENGDYQELESGANKSELRWHICASVKIEMWSE